MYETECGELHADLSGALYGLTRVLCFHAFFLVQIQTSKNSLNYEVLKLFWKPEWHSATGKHRLLDLETCLSRV